MDQFLYEWEKPLYQLAFQADRSIKENETSIGYEQPLLEQAYAAARQITQDNSKTFFMASGLLPPLKRRAIHALYAFCRISDDLVDVNNHDPLEFLENWYHPVVSEEINQQDLIAFAWADARKSFTIPWRYSEQLLVGVAQDMTQSRYDSFDELTQYCYGVASTVGLMSMHIIGFNSEKAYPYAIRLGVALQLTNILRDVGEDWLAGRVYLPKNELDAYGLTEDDLAAAEVTLKWRTFMQFQIERNRRLYAEAKPGIALLNRDGRLAITAAAELYETILYKIEKNDYNVFNRRAAVSKTEKLRKLPLIWRRAARGYNKGENDL